MDQLDEQKPADLTQTPEQINNLEKLVTMGDIGSLALETVVGESKGARATHDRLTDSAGEQAVHLTDTVLESSKKPHLLSRKPRGLTVEVEPTGRKLHEPLRVRRVTTTIPPSSFRPGETTITTEPLRATRTTKLPDGTILRRKVSRGVTDGSIIIEKVKPGNNGRPDEVLRRDVTTFETSKKQSPNITRDSWEQQVNRAYSEILSEQEVHIRTKRHQRIQSARTKPVQ